MRVSKKSTARNVMVFMTDSSDHISGKTGLTLTITASKDGAAFSSISPTVTERGSGWYNIALTTSHTDTVGDLALHVTASGADPSDLVMQIVEYDPNSATNLGLSNIDATVSSRLATSSYSAPLDAAGTRTALGLSSANLDTQLSTIDTVVDRIELDTQDIQSRLPAALVSGRIDASVGAMAANTVTASALASDAVTEIQSGLATAAELATVDGVVDNIKVVTDKLDTMLEADGSDYIYTAVALQNTPSTGPTTEQIAEAVLLANWEDISSTPPDYCLLMASYALRNKFSTEDTPGTYTVYAPDGTTVAWTRTLVTDPSADPIVGTGA